MRALLSLLAVASLCSCGTAEFSGLNGKVRHKPVADVDIEGGDKSSAKPANRDMFGFNVFYAQNVAIKASTNHLGASQKKLVVEFDIIDQIKN